MSVRWDEAFHLARGLFKDTTSWLFAALKNWDRPVHALEPLLADHYDLANQKFAKQRVKPYPRHWVGRSKLGGKAKGARTSTEVRSLLRRD